MTRSRVRFIAFLGVICVLLSSLAGPLGSMAESLPHYVVLERVHTDQGDFLATASRGPGEQGGRRPCVVVSTRPAGSKGFISVGPQPCGLPRLAFGGTLGREPHSVSAVALVFPAAAVRVHLDFGEGGERNLGLRLLSHAKAREAGIVRFRYALEELTKADCLSQVLAYDRRGHEIYEATSGSDEPCGPIKVHPVH
jgi:hypothetical protein